MRVHVFLLYNPSNDYSMFAWLWRSIKFYIMCKVENFLEQFFPPSQVFLTKFSKEFCAKFSIFICFQSFEKSKKIKPLGILFCSSFYISIKKFFLSIFFIILFSNTLFSHTWAIISNLSLGFLYCEKIICDPLRSPRECLWSLLSLSVFFFTLCFARCLPLV